MRGIIYKDLYDNFRVWKNLASYIFALIFIFGKRIGTIVFVVLIAVAAGAYGSLSVIFGIVKFVQMDKTLLLCAGFPVSVLVFAVSCLISIFVYKKNIPEKCS